MTQDQSFAHLNARGEVHMVSVGDKEITLRHARAVGVLKTTPDMCRRIREGATKKGDVLAVARVAGIMAAKRTSDWIPLCHPVALTGVEVAIEVEEHTIRVTATVQTRSVTGVEMEALTSVSAALLTLYDMLKGQDRSMVLQEIKLLEKEGGRSGHFVREG